jgi:hypothetical protein
VHRRTAAPAEPAKKPVHRLPAAAFCPQHAAALLNLEYNTPIGFVKKKQTGCKQFFKLLCKCGQRAAFCGIIETERTYYTII